ncbi:hypothetical protein N2152v2_008316 [Parachlorella kessleri]
MVQPAANGSDCLPSSSLVEISFLALAPQLQALSAAGAFQLTAAGLKALLDCSQLSALVLDETTLRDADLGTLLGGLRQLRHLSLRRCMFLQGGFLQALAPALTCLQSLDLAGCGLSLSLPPSQPCLEALASIASLTHLDLSDGNGVDDSVVLQLACLQNLRSVGLRGSRELTEAGLAALAGGACAPALRALDLTGCNRLSEGCWGPLSELPNVQDLALAGLPHLLCHGAAPEPLAAVLRSWRGLSQLSLAGTMLGLPGLVAEACGATLRHLDISSATAPGDPASRAWWPAVEGAAGGAAHLANGGASQQQQQGEAEGSRPVEYGLAGGGVPLLAAGPRRLGRGCYARLTPRQLKALCEALAALTNLRSFNANGSCLPCEAAVALMAGAPSLTWLGLAGCTLEPRQPGSPLPLFGANINALSAAALSLAGAASPLRRPVGGSALPAAAGRATDGAGSSGASEASQQPRRAARALWFSGAPAAEKAPAGPSTSNSAPAPSASPAAWDRAEAETVTHPSGAVGDSPASQFAQALGGLKHLVALDLGGCPGLSQAHLARLGALTALRRLCLADCRGVDDALLGMLTPAAAGASPAAPLAAAATAGPTAAPAAPAAVWQSDWQDAGRRLALLPLLDVLDLSGTAVTDAGLGALAGLANLCAVSLARCAVGAKGLAAMLGGACACHPGSSRSNGSPSTHSNSISSGSGVSRALRGLDISRCSSVDDAALGVVAAAGRGLRWLRASGCPGVGQAGVLAVARQLPRLTRLELARCPAAVTDDSLAAICQHLTLLTHVDVAGSVHLTAQGLAALGSLGCLAELDLTCCRQVDDQEAQQVLPRVTRANVEMAGGSRSLTGSPIKQRRQQQG